MARWLSPPPTPLAEWLWVKPTAAGAIVPLIEVVAEMVTPTMNNGGVDPAVINALSAMPAPIIRVDTGTNAPPPLAATAQMPTSSLEMVQPISRGTATAAMVVPIVKKTVVCFPTPVTFTLSGKVPTLPIGSGKFPSTVSLTITGHAPSVSSVTPTAVQPTAASFTITGTAPTFPTGPRFGNYTFPITLD